MQDVVFRETQVCCFHGNSSHKEMPWINLFEVNVPCFASINQFDRLTIG